MYACGLRTLNTIKVLLFMFQSIYSHMSFRQCTCTYILKKQIKSLNICKHLIKDQRFWPQQTAVLLQYPLFL